MGRQKCEQKWERKQTEEKNAREEEKAQKSWTERKSKMSTMWIVVNDRVQLNEGM